MKNLFRIVVTMLCLCAGTNVMAIVGPNGVVYTLYENPKRANVIPYYSKHVPSGSVVIEDIVKNEYPVFII